MHLTKLALASVIGVSFAAPAAAGPFQIEIGEDRSGDGNTDTHEINKLEVSTTLFTSFYDLQGNTVTDTNRQSVMNDRGFAGAVGESNPSSGVDTFRYPENSTDFQDNNITGFSPSGVPETRANNFSSADWTGDFGGDAWGLTVDYDLSGTFDPDAEDLGGSVNYNAGRFDVFFEEEGTDDRVQVLAMDVEGSNIVAGDIEIFGNVTFDFLDEDGDDFVENFFFDVGQQTSFYELAAEDQMDIPLRWILDTNVRALDSLNDLVALDSSGDGVDDTGMRQTTGNAGIAYQVPEPSALLLLGTGLLFIGMIAGGRARVGRND